MDIPTDLPRHELTQDEVNGVKQQADVEEAVVDVVNVDQWRAERAGVVGIEVADRNRITTLGFDPQSETWKEIMITDRQFAESMQQANTRTRTDWFSERYELNSVAKIAPSAGIRIEEVLSQLGEEPVDRVVLDEVGENAGAAVQGIGQFAHTDAGAVGLSVGFIDIHRLWMVCTLGYDSEAGEWTVIGERTTTMEVDEEPSVVDSLFDELMDWLSERYDSGELSTAQNGA